MSAIKSILRYLFLLRDSIIHKVTISSSSEKAIIDNFHRLYYRSYYWGQTWRNTYWMGIPIFKCPLDLWVYQEIFYKIKPDLIIETGTFQGGSALYMAGLCDLINNGKILTIDITSREGRPSHDRITYLEGSSTSATIIDKIKTEIKKEDKILVLLDSDHSKNHVLNEINIYSKIVTKGSYLIVEDTNVNGHPVAEPHGDGPMEAVMEYLKTNNDLIIDKEKEKFLLTFNPRGYLKKVK